MFSPFSVSECLCLQGTPIAAPLVRTKWEKSLRPASADHICTSAASCPMSGSFRRNDTRTGNDTAKGPKESKMSQWQNSTRSHESSHVLCGYSITLLTEPNTAEEQFSNAFELHCVCLKFRLTLPALQLLITGNPNTTRRKYVTERKSWNEKYRRHLKKSSVSQWKPKTLMVKIMKGKNHDSLAKKIWIMEITQKRKITLRTRTLLNRKQKSRRKEKQKEDGHGRETMMPPSGRDPQGPRSADSESCRLHWVPWCCVAPVPMSSNPPTTYHEKLIFRIMTPFTEIK